MPRVMKLRPSTKDEVSKFIRDWTGNTPKITPVSIAYANVNSELTTSVPCSFKLHKSVPIDKILNMHILFSALRGAIPTLERYSILEDRIGLPIVTLSRGIVTKHVDLLRDYLQQLYNSDPYESANNKEEFLNCLIRIPFEACFPVRRVIVTEVRSTPPIDAKRLVTINDNSFHVSSIMCTQPIIEVIWT